MVEKFLHRLNSYYFGPRKGDFKPAVELAPLSADEQKTIDDFHDLYYRLWLKGRGTIDLSWFGFQALKCPLDLWVYQEILFEVQPTLIVECGSHKGGSGLFLAHMCELMRRGRVLSIDLLEYENRPSHPLLEFVTGSSVDPDIIQRVCSMARGQKTLVILDSDHRKPHVLAEMLAYKDIVSTGSYLIVEDSNINGHPTLEEYGPGPMEAIDEFLPAHPQFEVDRSKERFLLTLNPSGFLRKVR